MEKRGGACEVQSAGGTAREEQKSEASTLQEDASRREDTNLRTPSKARKQTTHLHVAAAWLDHAPSAGRCCAGTCSAARRPGGAPGVLVQVCQQRRPWQPRAWHSSHSASPAGDARSRSASLHSLEDASSLIVPCLPGLLSQHPPVDSSCHVRWGTLASNYSIRVAGMASVGSNAVQECLYIANYTG